MSSKVKVICKISVHGHLKGLNSQVLSKIKGQGHLND